MAKRADKKIIMIPSELAAQLAESAVRQGKTFSSFLQESLEQALRAGNMGTSNKEVIDYYEIMQALRASGAAFVPSDVLRYLVRAAMSDNKGKLYEKWRESGEWFGKFLITKFHDRVEAIDRLLRASRWDLDEVKITSRSSGVEILCISDALSLTDTECLRYFIEGTVESLGYKIAKRDVSRGIVFLIIQGNRAGHTEHLGESKSLIPFAIVLLSVGDLLGDSLGALFA